MRHPLLSKRKLSACVAPIALALALCAPSTAGAVQKVKPTTTIEAAKKTGKHVKFTIDVSFPLPTGDTAANDCKGKVTASFKLSAKKTIKWSASLKPSLTGCLARIKATLPAAKYGKKLNIKTTFRGNTYLSPFKATSKLTIITPPAGSGTPPAGGGPVNGPTSMPNPQAHKKGHWKTLDGTSYGNVFDFTVNDDDTITSFNSGIFEWDCGTPPSPVFGGTHYQNVIHVSSDRVNDTYHWVHDQDPNHYDVTYHLLLTFTGPTEGYGHLDADGDWGPELDCHLSEDFSLAWQGT